MSTKINNGIRFPVKHLNEFLKFAYQDGIARCAEHTRWLITQLDPTAPAVLEISKKFEAALVNIPEKYQAAALQGFQAEHIFELYRDHHHSTYAFNPFSMAMGWNVWSVGRWVYAYPWGNEDNLRARAAREELPFVQAYFYNDQGDRPPEISRRDWFRRRDNWERCIARSGLWHQRLTFVIADFSDLSNECELPVLAFMGCNKYEIARQIHAEREAQEATNETNPADL